MIGWELSSFLDLIRLIRIAIEHNLRSYANCEVSKDRDDFGKTMQTFALHSLTGSDTTTVNSSIAKTLKVFIPCGTAEVRDGKLATEMPN
jgi:hypothetical protein